jgi:hypothetical protein
MNTKQRKDKAEKLVALVLGSSALEADYIPISKVERAKMVQKTIRDLEEIDRKKSRKRNMGR